ncbi:hypothetical protein L6R52_40075, partial [Myxococcota bacterium]|nr:hypothetical protein [Myxococcota bacterium]
LATVDQLRAQLARPALVPRPIRPGRPAAAPTATPVFNALAPLVARTAGTPLAGAVMKLVAERMDAFAGQPASHALLARAGQAANLHDACDALISAEQVIRTRNPALPPDLAKSVQGLRALPEATALQVTLAFLEQQRAGRGDAALLEGLVRFAVTTRPDDPVATFSAFASRWAEVGARFAAYPALAPEKSAVMERITLGTIGTKIDANALNLTLLATQLAKQYLPLANASALLAADLSGRPGLLAALDPRARFGTPLNETFAPLVQGIQAKVKNDKPLQEELAPIAAALALETAKIVGGKGLHTKRITADWNAAVANPDQLKTAARGQGAAALRAQQQPSVAKFLEAHPELPVDLALTAGLHLSPDQLAWLVGRIAASHGRDTVRMLRDFVFACVDAGKLDLVEAARTSASPTKAISAVITSVAQSYRNNELGKIPFDLLSEGLRAGRDPQEELVATQTKQALAALKLDALAPGKVSAEGLREIASISANVADLLAQYTPEFKSTLDKEIDMGALRPVFLACLTSVIDGSWPKPKYENDVGKRIMAGLTPAQQAVWRETMLTSAVAARAPGADDALREPMLLAKGLLRAIPKEARLDAGLAFDAASAEKLRAKHGALLDALRNAEKGSEAHRTASKELGPIGASLAAIELVLALDAKLGGERAAGANPKETLLALRPELEAGVAALKKLGAKGSAEAVAEILGATRDLDTTPVRTGRYAIDEDGLAALIDSHKTGCLSFGDKRRRWGMAGALADPNIRMLRVMDGDKQRYRTFLKFFQVELPGYKGPALWIDAPRPDGGGTPEDLALLYKHLFEKGRAMGIPVMGPALGQLPEGWTQKNVAVTFHVDDGNTGYMHSDSLFGGKGSIRTSRGANPVWTMAKNVVVATPPQV